jgi:hypothetical protein
MFNHSELGQRSLEDVIGIWGHQCRALGHEVIWDTKNVGFLMGHEGINVIVEGFVPQHAMILGEAVKRGARFVMLATEEPTERGFNHGTQVEMIKRQKDFHLAAPFFEGILYLVPGKYTHDFYNQFCPSEYVDLGYAPTLVRNHRITPTYDFGFYGSLTQRRYKLLKRLAKRIGSDKAVKIVADFKTQEERDKLMSEAKVILQIRKFDSMGLVSSSRCNTALSIGRPVLAEPHNLSKPWDEVVRFTDTTEGFLNVALIMRGMWKEIWADQFAKFKEKFSPQFCVGDQLEKIGVLDPARIKAKVAA